MEDQDPKLFLTLYLERQYSSSRFWQQEWLVIAITAVCLIILANIIIPCPLTSTTTVSLLVVLMAALNLWAKEQKYQYKLKHRLFQLEFRNNDDDPRSARKGYFYYD